MIEPLLSRLTGLIVRACDAEEVVLFGSYTKGQQNIDSDIDLLVIGNFQGSAYLVDLELRQLLRGCAVRIDLHVATPQQIAAESERPFGFLSSVLAGGKRLYRKNTAINFG